MAWSGRPREYRISQGHDAAAALVVDGRVVAAAAEERFNRKKHSGDFPDHGLRFCLEHARLELEEVDEIAHSFDYAPYREIFSLDSTSARLYDELLSRDAILAELARDCPGYLRTRQWLRQNLMPPRHPEASITQAHCDAAAALQAQVVRWFDVAPMTALPYMTFTVDVREEYRAALPAITHINDSAREQTVLRADNPDFHMLLREVGERTGREMVLNTSFNVKGQPIVNTAAEVVETFLGTDMDALFLENIRVERKAS